MKVISAPDFSDWKKAKDNKPNDNPIPAGWITVRMAQRVFGVKRPQSGTILREMVADGRAEVQPWKSMGHLFNIYRLKK